VVNQLVSQPQGWRWQDLRDGVQTLALVLLGLATMSSVAGVNIAKALLLGVFLTYLPQLRRLAPWRDPCMAAGLILMLFIWGVSWAKSGFDPQLASVMKHYQELLLAPILLVLVRTARHPRVLLGSLLAGAIVLACVHWVALFSPSAHAALSSRRISAGFMLAVSAFIVLVMSLDDPRPWLLRLLAAGLGLTTLFAIGGRTGYVVLFVLTVYAAGSLAARRWRGPAVVVTACALVLAAVSSDEVRSRVDETVSVVTRGFSSDAVKKTSTAIRVHMLHISRDIAEQHAFVGVGYGNYAEAYQAALDRRVAHDPALYSSAPEIWTHSDNPHNEYLMQLLGGGVAGLGLFVLWLAVIYRHARSLPAAQRRTLKGLCLAFGIGCMFNSLLLDFTEGHFFVVVMVCALCAAPTTRAPKPA
jgi:O-antigen ligase